MSTVATRPGDSPRVRPPLSGRRAGLLAAAAAAALGLGLAWNAGVKSPETLPDVFRVVAAAAVLFTACGYVPARLLLPRALTAHLVVLVPAVGAAVSALALTALGFLHVPIEASLAMLVALGTGAAVLLRSRHGPAVPDPEATARAGGVSLRVLWPAYIAALAFAITLIPTFRAEFVTTTGQNGDAILAAGTAEFLQNTPPRGEDISLYVDRMPDNWRSKYPIYYVLAGVSELSGLEPIQVLPTAMSLLLALLAVGFFLFAYDTLRSGPVAALVAMAFVAANRIVLYLVEQPFYNQIWGVFALSLILVFGLRFLREPTRGGAALLAIFTALGAFAYPLMLPYPAVALGLSALLVWRRRRAEGRGPGWIAALGLPRGRRMRLAGIAGAVLVAPFAAFALLGVAEKAASAADVILPGSSLAGWNALPFYLPFHRFFGLVDPIGIAILGVALLLAAAAWALYRLPREVGIPLAVTFAGALAFGAYFKARDMGAFFYFKDLSFLGPLVTATAVVGLTGLVAVRSRLIRSAGVAALAVLAVSAVAGIRTEVFITTEQLTRDTLEVRDWSRTLPRNASVLISVRQAGPQLWAQYMLADHPISAVHPIISDTFPAPPLGLKADFLLQRAVGQPPPRNAVVGGPLRRNRTFRLWRMNPRLRGPDTSSRRTTERFSTVFD